MNHILVGTARTDKTLIDSGLLYPQEGESGEDRLRFHAYGVLLIA